MAGDWIKMRMNLRSHPKVVRILSALNADTLRVIGGLHAVWSVFDEHTDDGRLDGYTLEALDKIIGWDGFCEQLVRVGWLEQTPESLVMPRFEAHNGSSAKRRAQESNRKSESRRVRKVSALNADKTQTKSGLEKRREDSSVPKGTGGDAAEGCEEEDPPTDPVKKLFDTALPLLVAAGQTEKAARSLVGKARAVLKDDGAMQLVVQAARQTDPAAYIAKALQPKPRKVQLC